MRMIRPRECAKKLGISRTTLHRWRKQPGFPTQYRLGANSVAYDEWEVEEWLKTRRQTRPPRESLPEAHEQPSRITQRRRDP